MYRYNKPEWILFHQKHGKIRTLPDGDFYDLTIICECVELDNDKGATGLRKLRVIIADDNNEFRRTLSEYLETMEGIEIIAEAIDGKHVVELALKTRPDIVIMDISMPLRTGIESTRLIKNHYPEITVVILTLHDAAIYRQLAKEAKADGFISKHAMKGELERFITSQQLGKTYEA